MQHTMVHIREKDGERTKTESGRSREIIIIQQLIRQCNVVRVSIMQRPLLIICETVITCWMKMKRNILESFSVLALDLEGVHDVKLHHPSSSVATSNQ